MYGCPPACPPFVVFAAHCDYPCGDDIVWADVFLTKEDCVLDIPAVMVNLEGTFVMGERPFLAHLHRTMTSEGWSCFEARDARQCASVETFYNLRSSEFAITPFVV